MSEYSGYFRFTIKGVAFEAVDFGLVVMDERLLDSPYIDILREALRFVANMRSVRNALVYGSDAIIRNGDSQEIILAYKALQKPQYLTEYAKEVLTDIVEGNLKPREPIVKQRIPRPGYVYLIKSSDGLYKIGYSKEPVKRIENLGVKLPFPITTSHLIKTDDMLQLEKSWHEKFDSKRERGEWFALSDSQVAEFKSHQEINYGGVS